MFQLDKEDLPVVKKAVMTYYDAFFEEEKENRQQLKKSIKKVEEQLDKIQERFALGQIDNDLYLKFSSKYNMELAELTKNNESASIDSSNLEKCLQKVLEFCLNPLKWWESQSVERKMQIQKVIFPDGISLLKENRTVLTSRINSIFAPIPELARSLSENKKGQTVNFNHLSFRVTSSGFKPETS